jgi:hypothetical protein
VSKEKLVELKERVLALNAELSTVYKEGLKEYAADLLAKYPKVKGISWTQYTPYFNDGEPCEFGINADYPQILIEADGEEDWHDMDNMYTFQKNAMGHAIGYQDKYKIMSPLFANDFTLKEHDEILESIREFASDALYPFENQLQALIGEGRVLLTKDGIEVEDYDHD